VSDNVEKRFETDIHTYIHTYIHYVNGVRWTGRNTDDTSTVIRNACVHFVCTIFM